MALHAYRQRRYIFIFFVYQINFALSCLPCHFKLKYLLPKSLVTNCRYVHGISKMGDPICRASHDFAMPISIIECSFQISTQIDVSIKYIFSSRFFFKIPGAFVSYRNQHERLVRRVSRRWGTNAILFLESNTRHRWCLYCGRVRIICHTLRGIPGHIPRCTKAGNLLNILRMNTIKIHIHLQITVV